MKTLKTIASCFVLATILGASFISSQAIERARALELSKDLKLEPPEALVSSGDNVTFSCSYPHNVTLHWDFMAKVQPASVVSGYNDTGEPVFFSKATLVSVTRITSGEVRCSVLNDPAISSVAFLVVNGVRNGGSCHSSMDCMTDRATCQRGVCTCPKNHVLLRLTESGYEVCREMIYSLYDPCEFLEQCSHLVDSKSVCSSNSVCICAPWAVDINGRCFSKNKVTYKSQEMYRVGLIAVTCIIILIVALSLWITLRRSCREQNMDGQMRSINPMDPENFPSAVIMEIDKPPSYDDVRDQHSIVNSPPNFNDALKHCPTAKKFLRQASAPAGQLLPQTMSQTLSPVAETGCGNKAFSADD